jgi:cell division septal protein FtsQ
MPSFKLFLINSFGWMMWFGMMIGFVIYVLLQPVLDISMIQLSRTKERDWKLIFQNGPSKSLQETWEHIITMKGSLPWIQHIDLRYRSDHHIFCTCTEFVPVYIWQQNSKTYYPVTAEGLMLEIVLTHQDLIPYISYSVISCESLQSLKEICMLLTTIQTTVPQLRNQIKMVQERRSGVLSLWTHMGSQIILPRMQPIDALYDLLQSSSQDIDFLNPSWSKKLKTVDMSYLPYVRLRLHETTEK